MNRVILSAISFFLCLCTLIGSLASLLVVEKYSSLPFNLFYLSCLFIAITLALRYKDIIASLSKEYFWLTPRQGARIIILGVLCIGAFLLSFKKNQLYDLTEEQFFTLSKGSLSILKSFDFSLQFYANPVRHGYFSESFKRFEEVLKSHLPGLKTEWINPEDYPDRVKKEGLTSFPCVVLQAQEGKTVLLENMLFSRLNLSSRKRKFFGEAALTQALIRLRNSSKIHLYFPGQGKTPILDDSPRGYTLLFDTLEGDGFQVQSVEELPETSEPLMIFLPLNPLEKTTQAKLLKRIRGNLPTLLYYDSQPKNPFPELTKEENIQFLPFPVVDHMRNFRSELTVVLPHRMEHLINLSGDKESPLLFSGSSAFLAKGKKALLKSSSLSWMETNINSKRPSFDEGRDIRGPLTLAFEFDSKVLVFGDQDHLRNQFMRLPGHLGFLLGSVHYIKGNLEFIQERGRTLVDRKVSAPKTTRRKAAVFFLFVLPFLSLGLAGLLGFLRWKN